jgi:hypothetical protein
MGRKRFDKEYADDEKSQNESMTKEERERMKNEYIEIAKVLYKYNNSDIWGDELERYFLEINNKLRKYIK